MGGTRRCHTLGRKERMEMKKPAQKAQAKNICSGISKRNRMFSANDSWLTSFIPGRSSDLAIDARRRLPGQMSSDILAQRSRLTATSSCRTCTCFPFHPDGKTLRTPRTLCSLGNMIAHKRYAVKGETPSSLPSLPFSLPYKGKRNAAAVSACDPIRFDFSLLACGASVRMRVHAADFLLYGADGGWVLQGFARSFFHSAQDNYPETTP